MDRQMHQLKVGVSTLQSFDRSRSAMRGAVIHDPKNSWRAAIRLLFHHLLDQSSERLDARGVLAAAKYLRPSHIPSSQVRQCAAPLIFELHAHGFTRPGRQCRMQAKAGLDARFFVSRNDAVLFFQGLALPKSLVEVQNSFRFALKIRVARKDPTAMPPGANRIFIEP